MHDEDNDGRFPDESPVEVRNLQVHVPDVYAGIDGGEVCHALAAFGSQLKRTSATASPIPAQIMSTPMSLQTIPIPVDAGSYAW